MTGEISLSKLVLPVGGSRKSAGCSPGRLKQIILPKSMNLKGKFLEEVRRDLQFILVQTVMRCWSAFEARPGQRGGTTKC